MIVDIAQTIIVVGASIVAILGTLLIFLDLYENALYRRRKRKLYRTTRKRVKKLSRMKNKKDRDVILDAYIEHSGRNSLYKYSNPFNDYSWELGIIAEHNPHLTAEELEKYASLDGSDELKRYHEGALQRVISDERTPTDILIKLVVSSPRTRASWYCTLLENSRVPEEYKVFAALNTPAKTGF